MGKLLLSAFFCVCFSGVAIAQLPSQLPTKSSKIYANSADKRLSDEFNGKEVNWAKWNRRMDGGVGIEDYVTDGSLVVMESEECNGEHVEYVSMKATTIDGKPRTAGLVGETSGHFGFYTVRFRFKGLNTEDVKKNMTIWHPSVWSSVFTHQTFDREAKISGDNLNWLEIDLMEWETGLNSWSCDAPARFTDSKGEMRRAVRSGEDMEKAMIKECEDRDHEQWTTLGLEYADTHMKLWEWIDGKWVDISDREVKIIDDNLECPEKSFTPSSIARSVCKPMYWIVGGVVSRFLYPSIQDGTCTHSLADAQFDYDFFRYYPLKSIENEHWAWREGLEFAE
ncbi:MAG: hypothetical protein R3Y50_06405 [Rikenellaceae bacterium]